MIVQSKAYGAVEIDEEHQVYHFAYGIPAFEHLKRWALFEAKQMPFFIFQSLDEEEVAFFVMNPWLCRKDYAVNLEESDVKRLDIQDEQKMMIFAILTIPVGKPHEMSINLQAPLVFNSANLSGMQMVQTDVRWQVRHSVAEEMEKEGKGRVIC